MRRWARRAAVALALTFAVLAAAVALTMRPGDRRLYPPQTGTPAVTVFLVSHGYHAGVVLSRAAMAEVAARRSDAALSAVAARFALYPWIEIGWGEEGFYRNVPTIASLTFAMAVRALFAPGNPSVLHVVGLSGHPAVMFPHADIVAPALSAEGFEGLVDRIDRTFAPARAATRSKTSAGGSTARACSTAPSAHSTFSASATIGSPTCSTLPAFRRRRSSPRCPKGCSWI